MDRNDHMWDVVDAAAQCKKSRLMEIAEAAASRVATWSPAKQAFADRVIKDGSTMVDDDHQYWRKYPGQKPMQQTQGKDATARACPHCEQFRVALQDLVDRWSTERGYDGAIQRARKLLMDHALRCASAESVTAALGTVEEMEKGRS